MRQLWTSLSEETRVPGPLPKSDKAAPRVEFSKQSLRWFQSTLLDRNDWLVVTFFAVTVAVGCLSIAGTLPPSIFQTMEYWFEADTLREVSNTTRVHNDHYRMSVHPLFSLFTLVPVYVLELGIGFVLDELHGRRNDAMEDKRGRDIGMARDPGVVNERGHSPAADKKL